MRDGAAIITALGGHREGKGWRFHCPYPDHEDGGPSAFLFDNGSTYCFGCRRDVSALLDQIGFRDIGNEVDPFAVAKSTAEQDAAAIVYAQQLWDDAGLLPDTGSVASYLRHRSITLPVPPVLRRWSNGFIAAIQQLDGRITAVHTKSPARRRSHGRFFGGAVQLAPPRDGQLGLAEGVEDAFSATLLFGTPCWAVIGTRLDAIDLPADVTCVHIFADNNGQPGRDAAQRAELKYLSRGISVEDIYWPDEGLDWNDMLRRGK